ncbi:glycoside hydrolase family 16 protein [Mycena floridula]|nr:glycoside hydrolase family 16 protein [Mycena floridula]
MTARTISSSLLLLLSARMAVATSYDMVKIYAGPTFFDGWDFYGSFDNLTNGDVNFVTQAAGLSEKLAYVDPTTNRAIMKVDNTSTVVFPNKRDTVRIETSDSFGIGSLWTSDIYHVPFGCSVWPAWWSQAPAWPAGGEIDTFEGVNQQTLNQMSLHTNQGCSQVQPVQSSTLINSTDCGFETKNNQGCITTNPSPASYGAAFAAAGGGVFVTELAETGVSIWFFSRAQVPASLTSNSSTLNTADLGVPVANYPATGCPIDTFFAAQHLIFDITLCGDFARPLLAATCNPGPGDNPCYTNFVLGNGANYADAYFDVASVKVYSASGTNTVVTASGQAATGSGGGGSGALGKSIAWPLTFALGVSGVLWQWV